MLNNFCVFEELVFFDLWILDSGFWFVIPDSGFQIPIPESGFRFPGFRVALYFDSCCVEVIKTLPFVSFMLI